MPRNIDRFFRAALSVGFSILCAFSSAAEPLTYNRDIRPILSDNCFECHGPAKQKAGLRLDVREVATRELKSGMIAIVPGKPDDSELVLRISASDPDDQMPPSDSGHTLTAAQKNVLRQWVAAGAEYQRHWALEPIRKSPASGDAIDFFVRARLKQAGLQASPPASPETQLRRVSLDLTGLPPTSDEVNAFLAEAKKAGLDAAYASAVDRLLRSPRYGERMAWQWLEAARYADTDGYQNDGPREMWRWRDWVIDAFNANMPFDQFTIEQLAGDLLPNPTHEQLIATAFNRNNRYNSEEGIPIDEFLLENAVDRVDTTSTVWLGLTAGCARCHDHKYDPISQKEYYRLFAFFNNVPEKGIDGRHGAAKPFIEVPNPAVQERIAVLKRQLETRQLALAQLAEGSPEREVATKEIAEVEEAIKKLGPRAVTPVQVMQELPGRRPTYLLVRGVYDRPDTSEPLTAGLPSSLGGLSNERPA